MAGKKKARAVFVCQQCGNESAKWQGQCPQCGEWETLQEIAPTPTRRSSRLKAQGSRRERGEPVELTKIESKELRRMSTGFGELDRVLGGGLVEGQVVLLAGEPGIGKSTLLLQVAAALAEISSEISGMGCTLYVSGEESPGQVKIRGDRLGIKSKNILMLAETNVESVVAQIQAGEPINNRHYSKDSSAAYYAAMVIVDSIQSLWSEDLSGIPGAVGQVRLCSQKLIEVCKSRGIPLFLVGQVTKEGTIAGPKVLEHAVDTVLYLEGERLEELRILRCFKNRFGNVDELAVFTMEERGMKEVVDASRMFLSDEATGLSGTAWCPIVAGARVLLVEMQSLVVSTKLAVPRRISQGFPRARLEMIAAVVQKHLRLPLYKFDIFVNVSGGLAVEDPAADLAVALSIYSSLNNKPLPAKSCAFGELTLLAGIRPVLQEKKRRGECKRLGLKKVYSNKTSKYLPQLVKKIFVKN